MRFRLFGTNTIIDVALGTGLVWLIACARLAPPQPSDNIVDTTSHAFRWQVDTIGAAGSYLYDVCIINDTCAYAVGLIYPKDSSGQSNQSGPCNSARWNGSKWTLIKVPYLYQGHPVYSPIHTVFGFSPSDIWFGGNGLEYWNGENFANIDAVNSFWAGHLMSKIWGSSDNDLYVVGDGGIAVHFDGTWHGITTGTSLPFQDIWGSGSPGPSEQVIAIASDKYGTGGKYFLYLAGNSAVPSMDSVGSAVSFSGIWFVANQSYFLVGDGIYEKHSFSDHIWHFDSFTRELQSYPYAVRGAKANDVILACDAGVIAHYNGATWLRYSQLQNLFDHLSSVGTFGDQVIAVGTRNYDGVHYYGVIYHGWR